MFQEGISHTDRVHTCGSLLWCGLDKQSCRAAMTRIFFCILRRCSSEYRDMTSEGFPGLALGCETRFSFSFSVFNNMQKNTQEHVWRHLKAERFINDAQETQLLWKWCLFLSCLRCFTSVSGGSPPEQSSPVRYGPGSSRGRSTFSVTSFIPTNCNQNHQHLHETIFQSKIRAVWPLLSLSQSLTASSRSVWLEHC